MIHADAALARRLERLVCREWLRLAGIGVSLWPGKGVACMEVAGGVALWLGGDGLVNVAAGMGMNGPIDERELRRVEDFYLRRGATPMLATCPFADPTLFVLLGRRGWRLTEFENVLVLEPPASEAVSSAAPEGIELRVCRTPGERALFGRMAARGFSDEAEPGPAHLEYGEIMAAHGEHTLVLAWADGRPVGTGAIEIMDGVAWLSADSTLPQFRCRGIQQAIQRFRLQLAGEAGCSLVVTEAMLGSGSQRNMERLGFRVAYTHLHFAKV